MNKYLLYAAIFFAGVMLAGKARTLPLVNRLPSV